MKNYKIELHEIVDRLIFLDGQHRIGTDRYGTAEKELFFIISENISNYAISTFGRLAFNVCGEWKLVKYDNFEKMKKKHSVYVSDGEFNQIPFDSQRYKRDFRPNGYIHPNQKQRTGKVGKGKKENLYQRYYINPNGKHLICKNENSVKEWIEIETLMKWAFFPNFSESYKLYRVNPERKITPRGSHREKGFLTVAHEYYRYDINEMYLLDRSKGEHIEFLKAKMNNYSDCTNFHGKVLIPESAFTTADIAKRMCKRMIRRVEDSHYAVEMCEPWTKSPILLTRFLCGRLFSYPTNDRKRDNLEIDKDILSRFRVAIYSPDTCMIVPKKINVLFERTNNFNIKKEGDSFIVQDRHYNGTKIKKLFSNYSEAIQAARNIRAEKIRECVKYECSHVDETGSPYIPMDILKEIKLFARECENGEIEAWEPTLDKLKEWGVID